MDIARTLKVKSDRFKKARGGRSRWLLLSCASCKHPFARYQKDGPGMLKRLYLDRIAGIGDQLTVGGNLVCSGCKAVLGTTMIYKAENRPAFRLFAGAVEKKLMKDQDT